MGSNIRRNQAAIDQYRKGLEAMLGDITEIDKKVLNKSVNAGLREAKRITPVGVYKDRQGGFMKKSWYTNPVNKSYNGVSKDLFNTAEYAEYVNYGHRIVRNSRTYGFVRGKFILEKATGVVDKTMVKEFKKAVEEVNRRHGR
ncbi:MAG TPA: hypothetical protein DCM59_14640 [Clostridium sp.]|nr:hypothetical protein [Clostridium sp.]